MRKGGLEPEAAVEMIEEFRRQCCSMRRLVAQNGPQGPLRNHNVECVHSEVSAHNTRALSDPVPFSFAAKPHPFCFEVHRVDHPARPQPRLGMWMILGTCWVCPPSAILASGD